MRRKLATAFILLQALLPGAFAFSTRVFPSHASKLAARTGPFLHQGNVVSIRRFQSSATDEVAASPAAAPRASSSLSSFDDFDYRSHWYPVIWARDLKPDRPTKVTLFDVDYVVAKLIDKTSRSEKGGGAEEEVVAMVDSCPHKSASLSEGRVTSCGFFQCAYHGWTFDSKTGKCVEVPQAESRRSPGENDKADGTAVPAMIHQGMVWLFPFGGLEEALLAPPPPSVPEMDMEGYKTTSVAIRDFPDIDWTILLENIMDPDHGLFAHQAKPFDLYTASRSSPQKVVEKETDNGRGWTITSTTDAVPKLLARNDEMTRKKGKDRKSATDTKGAFDKVVKKDKKDESEDLANLSTTTFVAPSLVYMGRRDPRTGETSFVSAFYVCPVGAGRSRFMASSVGKVPGWLKIPRWFLHITLNNFLDQDTYLLATQNRHVMATESQLFLERSARTRTTADEGEIILANVPVRRSLYAYRSPTEKLARRLGQFFDATVGRVPGRSSTMGDLGGFNKVVYAPLPPREVVLDRYLQHTKVCPDSMGTVKTCESISKAAKALALVPLLLKALFAGTASVATGMKESFATAALRKCSVFLNARPGLILFTWIVSASAWYLSNKVKKEFYFKYDSEYRDRDMDKIPAVWMDHE